MMLVDWWISSKNDAVTGKFTSAVQWISGRIFG